MYCYWILLTQILMKNISRGFEQQENCDPMRLQHFFFPLSGSDDILTLAKRLQMVAQLLKLLTLGYSVGPICMKKLNVTKFQHWNDVGSMSSTQQFFETLTHVCSDSLNHTHFGNKNDTLDKSYKTFEFQPLGYQNGP